jgi:hypothetical protein
LQPSGYQTVETAATTAGTLLVPVVVVRFAIAGCGASVSLGQPPSFVVEIDEVYIANQLAVTVGEMSDLGRTWYGVITVPEGGEKRLFHTELKTLRAGMKKKTYLCSLK